MTGNAHVSTRRTQPMTSSVLSPDGHEVHLGFKHQNVSEVTA
jgi:hypothetical protein